jgi:quercetin dioxygenase-like cupin family protein
MKEPRRRRHRVKAIQAISASVLFAGGFASGVTLANDAAFTRSADAEDIEWGACPDFMPADCALAVLQGDPAQRNADVLFKLEGNTTAPNHRHTSAERMVLISGELEVDYEGQDVVTLRPGDYAYGPPELAHSATCRSAEPCVLFIAFEEPVDAIAVD